MPPFPIVSDTFTVGANTELTAYNAAYSFVANLSDASTTLSVRDATDNLQQPDATKEACYRYTGLGLLNQRVSATLTLTAAGASDTSLWARLDANGNGYKALWDVTSNFIQVSRRTGNGATDTQLATGGTVGAATYANAYIKVTTVSSSGVRIQAGDDTNGDVIDVTDTDAARHLTGDPGIRMYSLTGLTGGVDNFQVSNESFVPIRMSGAGRRR